MQNFLSYALLQLIFWRDPVKLLFTSKYNTELKLTFNTDMSKHIPFYIFYYKTIIPYGYRIYFYSKRIYGIVDERWDDLFKNF